MSLMERVSSDVTAPTTSVSEVMKLARESGVKIVDLRFVDLPGQRSTSRFPSTS